MAPLYCRRSPLKQPKAAAQRRHGAQQQGAASVEQGLTPLSGLRQVGVSQQSPASGQEHGIRQPSALSQSISQSQGAGQPLAHNIRGKMEEGIGADLSDVRVHHDAHAAQMAEQLDAKAFTVGKDIYFGQGEYVPHTAEGQHLLAHELVHTRQPQGVVRRQPRTRRPRQYTRAEFDRIMRDRYGVTVRTGTLLDQQNSFNRVNPASINLPNWQAWDPDIGGTPEQYAEIIESYAQMARTFGGTPSAVRTLTFYFSHYSWSAATNTYSVDRSVGGLTSIDEISLYASTGAHANEDATRRSRPGTVVGGAYMPRDSPTRAPSGGAVTRGNVIHELGHGFEQSIRNAEGTQVTDPNDIMNRFRLAVGWASDHNLYDMGQSVVRGHIGAGTVPPAQYRIDPARNWNDGSLGEQPITAYAATSASDDFAESLRAYLVSPRVLERRSPRRFAFFQNLDRRHPGGMRTPTP